MIIEPWHWLILGILLMIIELFITSMVSLAVGVAAVVVALLAWLLPIGSFTSVLLWLILSIIFTVLGFKYVKPKLRNRTTAGLGAGAIVGQTGMIIHSPQLSNLGKVRFSVPIFGADEWMCRSQDSLPLAVGERVVVLDVIGNELLVSLVTPK